MMNPMVARLFLEKYELTSGITTNITNSKLYSFLMLNVTFTLPDTTILLVVIRLIKFSQKVMLICNLYFD